jgi:serine/threonine protein kinase
MHNNTNASGVNESPLSADARVDCRAARGMLEIGLHHLTEEALQGLARHIDSCETCLAAFDDACPDAPAGRSSGASSPITPQSGDLISNLVAEVLDRHKRTHPPQTFALVRGCRPGRWAYGDGSGQLAPGQVLQGKSRAFRISGPMGYGEFTETYAAELVLLEGDADVNQGRRAVIKIPRVADDMSPGAAGERLGLLQRLIRVQAEVLKNLAGLSAVAQMMDWGDYTHWLHHSSADSTFVAYEFVDGLDLADYMAGHPHYLDSSGFRGLPTAVDFAEWARMLTKGLLEIHNRNVRHGDICPRNVLVADGGSPVFIDVGQSLFREVMNGARSFSGNFYRAPDGVGTPSSDLFSLGGLLFFLATGREPIGFTYANKEDLKRQISLKINEANPQLYHDDVGVADIIAMCLRTEGRVQHASRLLREIDTFWPEAAAVCLLDDLKSLTDPAAALDAGGNSVFLSVAGSHVRSLHQLLTNMSRGVFDATGSPDDIKSAAYKFLRPLGAGDEFVTVSLPAFWFPQNIGINGRFLSMCRNAAARGACVKRVLLINEDLSDPYLQEIVAAQLDAAGDLDPSAKSNFTIRYKLVTADERRRLVAIGKHFGLLVKGSERIALSPIYDANDNLVTLCFRSGRRQVEGLHEAFEQIWSESKPLVDLRLRTTLDPIEQVG